MNTSIEYNTPVIATWNDKEGFQQVNEKGDLLFYDVHGNITTLPYSDIETVDEATGTNIMIRQPNTGVVGERPCERKELIRRARVLKSEPVIVENEIKHKVLVELTFVDEVITHTTYFTLNEEQDIEQILLEKFNIQS